jgi:hypothetical protein
MKTLRTALAFAGASALLVGAMTAPALADTNVPIYGGTTTVTVTSSALPKITRAGIVMWGVNGASSKYVSGKSARQEFAFGITTPSSIKLEDNAAGGKVGSVVGGRIQHKGSIKFLNTNNGKVAKVGDFVVNLSKMKVFATKLNGDPIDPTAVFTVVPVKTPVMPTYNKKNAPTVAKVSGLNLKLTKTGAGALNDLLKTKFFDAGFVFAKASVKADLVK